MQFNNNFRSNPLQNTLPANDVRVYDPYRLTHNELREVIRKESQRLQELKRLYEKQQQILYQTHREKTYNDPLNTYISRKQQNFFDDDFKSSPIKILSMTGQKYPSQMQNQWISRQKPSARDTFSGSYSHRYQYDQPDSLHINSFGTIQTDFKSKQKDVQMQRLNVIEKRLRKVEDKIDISKHLKDSNRIRSSFTKKNKHVQKISFEQKYRDKAIKRIVYDSPEKSLQKTSEVKFEQTADSILPKTNLQQTSNTKPIKTPSTKKLKIKSKSTVFIRPKSVINLKEKQIKQSVNISSQVNQKIQNRLQLLSCVFKDVKWRNDKNEKDFLMNRFQIETKGRKQIRNLINTDTNVLKKHKMVVK